MIPIGDAKRRFGFPWMTSFLLMVGVTILILERFTAFSLAEWALLPEKVVAWEPSLYRIGFTLSCMFYLGPAGQWLAPIVNLLYLWVLGRKVEDACGSWGLLIVCLFGGAGGVIFEFLLFPLLPEYKEFALGLTGESVTVFGPAGVVAGLMGAYFVIYRMEPIRAWIPPLMMVPVPAFLHFLYWAGLEFVNFNRDALSQRKLLQIFSLEPNWPFIGALFVGLILGNLAIRQEVLFYRTLQTKSDAARVR